MPKRLTILALIATAILLGCFEERGEDVSGEPQFKGAIGSQYEVIGALDAYGIRKNSGAEVEYITLIPPPGIAGYEVGFTVPIKAGSKITILKVIRTNRWPDPNLNFIVALEATQLPADATINIALFRGNEGKERAQLNPHIYRKRPPD